MAGIKRLAVLGCTGSIGRQTLEVVRAFPQKLQVVALAAGRNLSLLQKQVKEFQPRFISSIEAESPANKEWAPAGCQVVSLEHMVSQPEVDIVVVATAGKAGLAPTLAAIRSGKCVALANKEVLVMAGEIVIAEARRHQVELLPVDSEHSAIWQCLQGEKGNVVRLLLTASGGPFRERSLAELAAVTPEEALRHPTWNMGPKVTIDSATLMNKGMETLEAHWLFSIPLDNIKVIIHPQSIIHSIVEFVDGSVKAQLSFPDMRLPIQYALSYPERWDNPELPRLDWTKLSSLTFQEVDNSKFPSLRLAQEAGKRGGSYPAVLCGADEIAVELFLRHHIGFLDIAGVVEKTLERHQVVEHPSLEDILSADAWAREVALEVSKRGSSC